MWAAIAMAGVTSQTRFVPSMRRVCESDRIFPLQAIWHNKGKVRSYGELFKEGDVIGVRLDLDAGNLSFTRNGKMLGVAVEGLSGELFPAFSMCVCHCKASPARS